MTGGNVESALLWFSQSGLDDAADGFGAARLRLGLLLDPLIEGGQKRLLHTNVHGLALNARTARTFFSAKIV